MLNDIQLKLMALYAVVEPKVQTHYLDRFGNANPEYMSDNETILLKDLNDYLVEASIIERGSEIPFTLRMIGLRWQCRLPQSKSTFVGVPLLFFGRWRMEYFAIVFG